MFIPLEWAIIAALLAVGAYCFSYPDAVCLLVGRISIDLLNGDCESGGTGKSESLSLKRKRIVTIAVRIIGAVLFVIALLLLVVVMIVGNVEFYRLINSFWSHS